ncbi:MurR/RpiR family transcriptional regulator [Anaerotalea alkaliphila]|uniref:MurR/RpiR family transcriptional regulator n=1 Tax=Anaerotalea alkaliphila TaxID=2662126 RepID=A0A7X5KLH8_9FIRM|nr:MurR/RpiR family transcriptional regulator [Anaerotalea alkaliphila]NDL66856.1 MurR/RpiR family transcriptional regulator [Anaerotalea alkaliphila]
MNENVIALARIRQHYSVLSQSEKRIASYILENHEKLTESTTADLAERTGTSPATIVRFCRSLGFKGFSDFKLYLSQDYFSSSGKSIRVEQDENMAEIKQKTFRFNQNSVEDTMSLLSNESLERAVKAIGESSQVLIVGEGGSASSARIGFEAFLQIGIHSMYLEDPFFQVMAISRMPEDGVVIGITHSGRARNVIDSMKVAKEKGLTTIGLVGIVGSPVMKYTDIPLFNGVTEHLYFSDTIAARICELNVFSTLHAALSLQRKEILGDYRQEISRLLNIKRVKK